MGGLEMQPTHVGSGMLLFCPSSTVIAEICQPAKLAIRGLTNQTSSTRPSIPTQGALVTNKASAEWVSRGGSVFLRARQFWRFYESSRILWRQPPEMGVRDLRESSKTCGAARMSFGPHPCVVSGQSAARANPGVSLFFSDESAPLFPAFSVHALVIKPFVKLRHGAGEYSSSNHGAGARVALTLVSIHFKAIVRLAFVWAHPNQLVVGAASQQQNRENGKSHVVNHYAHRPAAKLNRSTTPR